MVLSDAVFETLLSMGVLIAFFITFLYLLGYPVAPAFHLVRNIALSYIFLWCYNAFFGRFGLSFGINPLTVGVLSLLGVHGFAAMNVVALLL